MKRTIFVIIFATCLIFIGSGCGENNYRTQHNMFPTTNNSQTFTLMLRVTGDLNEDGQYQLADDPAIPYIGDPEEDIQYLSSFGDSFIPVSMTWDNELGAYTANFTIKSDQTAWFAVTHKSRNPLAPEGQNEIEYGVFADIYDEGELLCSSLLVHYNFLSVSSEPGVMNLIYVASIKGIDTNSGCAIQDGNNIFIKTTEP